MTHFTSLSVFLFSALAFVVPSGYSIGAVLLILGSIILLIKNKNLHLEKDDNPLMRMFFLYFFVFSAINLFHSEEISTFDLPLRFLLIIPVFLLLKSYPPRPSSFWMGLAIGAISAGIFAGYQNIFMGNLRAGGHTNPIQFGNMSLLLGIVCLAGIKWAQTQPKNTYWIILLLLGAGSGILGSIFTGSRGSWISLPFSLFIIYICYSPHLKKKVIIGCLATVLGLVSTLYVAPTTGVKDRISQAVNEGSEYVNSGNAKTSTGARLEMWYAGTILIQEKPWLGWGIEGIKIRIAQLISEGRIDPIVGEHSHLHNEYLDVFAKRGIFGFLTVLGLYLSSLLIFIKHVKHNNTKTLPYAVAGILLPTVYIGFGLTQAFLTHNNGVMMYIFVMAFLWSLMRNEQRHDLHVKKTPVG